VHEGTVSTNAVITALRKAENFFIMKEVLVYQQNCICSLAQPTVLQLLLRQAMLLILHLMHNVNVYKKYNYKCFDT